MGMTDKDGEQKTMRTFLSLCWNQFIQHHFGKSKCAVVLSHSLMSDTETPWTVSHQAPLSMLFSRQEYWSGLPFPSPRTLPGGSQISQPSWIPVQGFLGNCLVSPFLCSPPEFWQQLVSSMFLIGTFSYEITSVDGYFLFLARVQTIGQKFPSTDLRIKRLVIGTLQTVTREHS